VMGPDCPLPLPPRYANPAVYLDDLINFCSTSKLWDQLCGGVHILDFFTRPEDLYAWLLPSEWRDWFEIHDLEDILDFLLREDLAAFGSKEAAGSKSSGSSTWRGHSPPPDSLLEYVRNVRDLLLDRTFKASSGAATAPVLPRHVSVGMKVKKVHEVALFSQYVTSLCADIARDSTSEENITHLVDFGSGQNYLGRTLASEPFNKHVIAVESKKSNIEGSRRMDVHAKLAPKVKKTRMVNKKEWNKQFKTTKEERLRRRRMEEDGVDEHALDATDNTDLRIIEAEIAPNSIESNAANDEHVSHTSLYPDIQQEGYEVRSHAGEETILPDTMLSSDYSAEMDGQLPQNATLPADLIEVPSTKYPPHSETVNGKGSVQYVEHRLEDGNLAAVLEDIKGFSQAHRDDEVHLNPHTSNEEDANLVPPANGTSMANSPPSLLVMVS